MAAGQGTGPGADIATRPATAVDQISLAAYLDQIEAGLNAAHNQIDTMRPREPSDGAEAVSEGALSAAARCQQKLAYLNQRLVEVSELVGTL